MGFITHPFRTLKRAANVITHPGKYLLHPLRTVDAVYGGGPSGDATPQTGIPYTDPTAEAAGARDKARRLAMRANGLSSTQRSGASAAYSGAPKSLLGM